MGFSVDAGGLSSKTTHIFAVCKNVDIQSRDKNGNLVFVEYNDDGSVRYKNIAVSKAN